MYHLNDWFKRYRSPMTATTYHTRRYLIVPSFVSSIYIRTEWKRQECLVLYEDV